MNQMLSATLDRKRILSLVAASAAGAILLQRHYAAKAKQSRIKEMAHQHVDTADGSFKVDKSVKVAVDGRFFKQLVHILKICIPSWRSSTVLIIMLHTFFLVLRTHLTVIVARIEGRLVKNMVAADGKSFLKGLGFFMAISIPATFTNSMIKYLQSKFAVSLRSKLTRHVHSLYMSNNTYYKAINLDNRIQGADQLITTDINRFCIASASLYSNVGKPLLDIIIFNYQLARSIGMNGMWGLALNYVITAVILRAVTPPFGKMAAEEARLEGDFRSAHSRLITNAEEIAFYNGEDLEKSILDRTYSNLIKHINDIYRIRIVYNMFEDFLIKYSWSAIGLIIASIPVFFPNMAGDRTRREEQALMDEIKISECGEVEGELEISGVVKSDSLFTGNRTQGFITNKRLMVSLADAGGRIMYSYKELSELAGYTYRVYNMIRVLEDLNKNKFVRPETTNNSPYSIEQCNGIVEYKEKAGISFSHTPIVTPYGDTVLVENLTLNIMPESHLMITGPNGAGKSSIMRVLAGIWPHFAGTIVRPLPELTSIMYIPQRPYLAIGTLRDQIIYPHSYKDMQHTGRTDAELQDILKIVYLDYIPTREGGLDAVKEWKDVFSGGEKQRIQLARLFYHKPKFAILDEATSAVSNDVESLLYTSAKEAGMTLITISHRPSLFKYHPYLLRIGEGATQKMWALEKIGTTKSLVESVASEIKKLKGQLGNMDSLRSRLSEINQQLSLDIKGEGLKHANRNLI
ncbi:hypothetical protein BDV3_002041 [Batrachochytrium dendrobatidis]|uniref:ABC transporter domain-containing protein n=1 Tax=Batrachochytrium dendrobatidis (strain JEL423) TaxID=403673 RepID=A0A177WV41_BATDL|nr:ATP-binding cassette long-chain fatty acid transporter pxa1 [Batrachochytrium dendrobatidis]KAK5664875.1 ATP-binding cassette long-chain fatty acid transporter pxa1 [Batrachochytrium dendrobatidis]OAJ43544.1 hypothetical protein BDEG_26897 [Batrachochytrium dendrobatidis JEL423]